MLTNDAQTKAASSECNTTCLGYGMDKAMSVKLAKEPDHCSRCKFQCQKALNVSEVMDT